MKIKTKNYTTIISGAAFIVLGIIFISINKTLSYVFIGIGVLIEILGVINEIKEETRKKK